MYGEQTQSACSLREKSSAKMRFIHRHTVTGAGSRNQAALRGSQLLLRFIVPDMPGIMHFESWGRVVKFSNRQRKTISPLVRGLRETHVSLRPRTRERPGARGSSSEAAIGQDAWLSNSALSRA